MQSHRLDLEDEKTTPNHFSEEKKKSILGDRETGKTCQGDYLENKHLAFWDSDEKNTVLDFLFDIFPSWSVDSLSRGLV
jgi:hypothetical protein